MLKKCLAVAMTLVAQVAFAAIGDSTKFDQDKFERIGDTLYYKISTAEQFEKLLEGVRIETDGYVVGLIEKDLVMGKDTLHLAKNKMSIDTSGRCTNLYLNGQGHTIYGLNMSRAMFYCVENLVENLTIANSRFESDDGLSAAGVAVHLKEDACVRNVKIRNSVVKSEDIAAGLVAYNDGAMLNDTNENSLVSSTNIAGGLAGSLRYVVINSRNSGRVSGRVAGGLVGTGDKLGTDGGTISGCSNSGMILGNGSGSVSIGGIAGYAHRTTFNSLKNTGLIEGKSTSGTLTVGGIVGRLDSTQNVIDCGNWGRIHALSGKKVYAGGIVGMYNGDFQMMGETLSRASWLVTSYNYGPVTVKASEDFAYAGGLAGYITGSLISADYNRGTVKNEGSSKNRYTGSLAAIVDWCMVAGNYSYVDTLTGSHTASLVYEFAGTNNYMYRSYYGGADVPPVGKYSDDTTNMYQKDSLVSLTFEEMKDTLQGGGNWVNTDCMAQAKTDTNTVCTVKVVADFFGDSDKPYEVTFLEEEGKTVVAPKVSITNLKVAVFARNISVWGAVANRPVQAFDMQGNLVASARPVGAVATLAVPKAGVYIVRHGNESRRVTIR